MMCLGASFVLHGPKAERVVPAETYFLGTYSTAIEPDEILTEIRVPHSPGWNWLVLRQAEAQGQATSLLPLRRCCCNLMGNPLQNVSITLTNVGPTALRAAAAEQHLRGSAFDQAAVNEAAQLAMAVCDPVEDLRGSVEYKIAMAGEMTRRALHAAAQRATH